MDGSRISESELIRNEERRLRELSEKITSVIEAYNIDCATIARAVGLDPRIVRRARREISVRADSERRIRYYIETKQQEKKSSKLVDVVSTDESDDNPAFHV